jgi:hypothetical protein
MKRKRELHPVSQGTREQMVAVANEGGMPCTHTIQQGKLS